MEAPIAVHGHGAGLPLQNQVGRKEWRVVVESSGRERMVPADGSGNQPRANAVSRPRSNTGASRRTVRNGEILHAASSRLSSDSDLHGVDVGCVHQLGASVTSEELTPQNISQGDDAAVYEEMHRPQQPKEHVESEITSFTMKSGPSSVENPDEAFQLRLHEVSRERERLQLAEVEMRAHYIARSDVLRLQKGLDEQAEQHADIVKSLQGKIQEREQQMRHLEQQLEERERQLRVNQMETNEAVWAKDGLLREQTNELATLRRERDNAIGEHKAASSQYEAERSELMAQLETLKDQMREKDRQLQEADEQNRNSQDIIHFKDEQMRDAQAWMTRASDVDAFYASTNSNLQNELRERTEQMNNLWHSYQRQLADVERYHAQLIHRLQQEVAEVREQNRALMSGTGSDRSDSKNEKSLSEEARRIDRSEVKGNKLAIRNSTRSNTFTEEGNALANGSVEGLIPVHFPRDVPPKVEHATGIPVLPAQLSGITPVLPPSVPLAATHPYGAHQQGHPPAVQTTSVSVPQASLAQMQPVGALLGSQQHLPSLQHHQVIHRLHPQQQLQPPIHRLSQRPQQQQIQPALPPPPQHLQQSMSLLTMTQAQESQHEQQERVKHVITSSQADQLSVPVTRPPFGQEQTLGQSAKQITTQPSHPSHQPQAGITGTAPEKNDSSAPPQQTGQEEQFTLQTDGKQKQSVEEFQSTDVSAHNRPQSSHQDRQSHDQRRRLDSRLPHLLQQQVKHGLSASYQVFHPDALRSPPPQPLQHQQGIVSNVDSFGGHNLPQGTGCRGQQEIQSVPDKPETRKSVLQHPKQPKEEALMKVTEPVLLDESSLLACLVRAVPAEPNARIRISSTLHNRLAKMLAPLHWHDYRKQFGRLDEFVGAHAELFVIEEDLIHLREGAHASFAATTAVAKAAAAAAAVTPVGPSQMPTAAITPVAQVPSQRTGNRKGFNSNQRDKNTAPPLPPESVAHAPSSTNARQSSVPTHDRAAAANGIMNHGVPTNHRGKVDAGNRHVPFNNRTESLLSFENGDINVFGSARTNGYFGGRQPGRLSSSKPG